MAVGFDLEAVLLICQLDRGWGMILFTTKLVQRMRVRVGVYFLTIQRSHEEVKRIMQDRKVGAAI